MSAQPAAKGRIITFYSYKGGTGRSQLLANVAMILASNQRRVAVIDWDLEAPGIHRYFRPFLVDQDLSHTKGLIDLVCAYWDRLVQLSDAKQSPPEGWVERYLDVFNYAVTLDLPVGEIVLVPAGCQNAAYASKVSNFDWDAFYAEAGGRGFIDALADRLRQRFDYVLIDSRTGVSDTAGICTLHMPDDLVTCFTYNNQNLDGAVAVATKAQRDRSEGRDHADRRPLRIFPVPTRADSQLPDLLKPRRDLAKALLSRTIELGPSEVPDDYWRDVEQPYLPVHSYHETLACLTDDPSAPGLSLLQTSQAVARRLTDGQVLRWIPMFDERTRERLRAEMAGQLRQEVSLVTTATEPQAQSGVSCWDGVEPAKALPVLLRLLAGADGSRSVPASLLAHLGAELALLQERGALVVRSVAGGNSEVALSTRALTDLPPERFGATAELSGLLQDVESRTRQWRSSQGRIDLLLSKDWLRGQRQALDGLRAQRALTEGEELFLATSERRLSAAQVRAIAIGGAGALLVGLLAAYGLGVWMLSQKSAEHAQQMALGAQKLQDTQLRAERAEAALAEARAEARAMSYRASVGNGHEAMARRDYVTAVKAFTLAEETADGAPDPDLYRARGEALDRLARDSKPAEAETLRARSSADFTRWVSLRPSASRHTQVAEVLLRNGKRAEAASQMDRAVALYPKEAASALTADQGLRVTRQLRQAGAVSDAVATQWSWVWTNHAVPTAGTEQAVKK